MKLRGVADLCMGPVLVSLVRDDLGELGGGRQQDLLHSLQGERCFTDTACL